MLLKKNNIKPSMKRPDTPLAATPDPIKNISVVTNSNTSNSNNIYSSNSSTNTVIRNEEGKITDKRISSNKDGKYTSASLRFDSDGNVIGNFEKRDKGKTIIGKRAEKKFNRIEKRDNEK
jgi:hypothetical protein